MAIYLDEIYCRDLGTINGNEWAEWREHISVVLDRGQIQVGPERCFWDGPAWGATISPPVVPRTASVIVGDDRGNGGYEHTGIAIDDALAYAAWVRV